MNRKPRLCMVVHADYPGDVRVARQARAAVADGFDVHVIALRAPGEPRKESVDGVRITRLAMSHRHGGGLGRVFREYAGFAVLVFLRLARDTFHNRPDVIHVHNPPDFLVFAALAPRLVGTPIVFDVHDLSPDMFAMRFDGRRGAKVADRLLRTLERVAAKSATSVITVHEPYRRELVDRGIAEEKTAVVMNSVDELVLPKGPPPHDGSFRVVYHGTVTPHYGVSLVIEAMAGLETNGRPPRFEIIGTGDSMSDLRTLTEELGLTGVVAITDNYLTQPEVLARIAGASAGVVPNLPTRLNRFALSTKLFEYVALGIPAVCSDLPTLREYFSPDEVLFFRAGDADALRAALEAVAADPEAATARAEAARTRALAYSWGENRARYLAILHSALAGHRSVQAAGSPAER